MQKNELNEQLKDYINQWRDERWEYFLMISSILSRIKLLHQGKRRGRAEASEGQAGREEGDPSRAGQTAGSEEEGGGRPEEEG